MRLIRLSTPAIKAAAPFGHIRAKGPTSHQQQNLAILCAAADMASGDRSEGPAPANSRLTFVSIRIRGDRLFDVRGA